MKKLYVSLILIIAVIFGGLWNVNKSYAVELQKSELSKRYQEWLELSEEERKNTIAPLPFNVRGKKISGIIGKVNAIKGGLELPSKYDLRDYINIEVKNQMDTGLCWGFSANSSVETTLAKQNGEKYNFSERHLEYDTVLEFWDGKNERGLNRLPGQGGTVQTAFTYYSRGSGPILEEEMPFENNENLIYLTELPTNVSVKKIDNMIYFPNVYKMKDEDGNLVCADANYNEYTNEEVIQIRNSIKEHIMDYGAVTINVLHDNGIYGNLVASNKIYDGFTWWDHSVTVIGWDDNFSKNNFAEYCRPKNDGAYIVLNSWGEEWGQNGVYYISYEDAFVESEVRGEIGISDIEYDNLYQYDISEMYGYMENKYGANIFTCEGDEVLTEIMIGSPDEQICNIYVNTLDGNLEVSKATKVARNVKLKSGYNTIKLNEEIELTKENKFAIIVELVGDNYLGIGAEFNIENSFSNAISNLGESFISVDGTTWEDIYNEESDTNLSIKAYTRSKESYVKILEIKYSSNYIFEGIGGNINIQLNTSKDYEGNDFGVVIYNELGKDITSKFNINIQKIKNRQGKIEINIPDTITVGIYSIKITNNEKVVGEENLVVSKEEYDTDIYMKVQFEDENLYKAIKEQGLVYGQVYAFFDITKEVIIKKDIEQINLKREKFTNNGFFEDGYDIRNLNGLENFLNLKSFSSFFNKIESIKPLENLENINDFLIENNQCEIKDVNIIKKWSNLTRLSVPNTSLDDIEFLKNSPKLYWLDIYNTNVKDISPLYDLKELYLLNICDLKIDNLEPLRNSQNLTWLYANNCNLSSLDDIQNLTNLYVLYAQNNNIQDISKLNKLTNLYQLFLYGNQISDIEVVKNFKNLDALELTYNNVCNIDPIEELKNLRLLYISYNKIEDLSVLDRMENDFVNLFAFNQTITKNLIVDENEKKVIVEVPKIIEQACNINSRIYSSRGIGLSNCEWSEYGKSIIIDLSKSNNASMLIIDGNAANTEFSVNIQTGRIDHLEIEKLPKTDYILEQDLDLTEGILKVVYTDGKEAKVPLTDSEINVKGYDKQKVGKQEITLEYKGKTVIFMVEVKTKELEAINITKLPNKIQYSIGERVDLTGIIITATYTDGSTKEITEGYTVTPEVIETVGEQEVTVRYTEGETTKEATFKVTVLENLEIDLGEYEEEQEGETIYLIGINPNTTIANFRSKIEANGAIEIIDGDKEIEVGEELIKTGYKLRITKGDEKKEYILVVKGDCNGDGKADFSDILKINKHRLNKAKLQGAYLKAGDITGDNIADFKDILKINKFRLNKIDTL